MTDERRTRPAGREVVLKSGGREAARTQTSGDGVFRFIDIPPGDYAIAIAREGYAPLEQGGLRVGASELVSVDLKLQPTGAGPRAEKKMEPGPADAVRPVVRPKDDPDARATPLPPGEKVYLPVPERWNLPLPDWDRYGVRGDYPYVSGHWWDPYNQNKLKGDYPVFGKRTFFNFTGVSDSLLEGRNLPTPSGVSTERPGSERFFGRGGALRRRSRRSGPPSISSAATPCSARSTGGSASRRRYSGNFVNLSEYSGVNADVRRQDTRLDHHLGCRRLRREEALRPRPSLRLPVGARRDPGVHLATSAASWPCSRPPASACSARSTRAGSNTTWRSSTCWRRTPTAASTTCTAATSRSTSPTSTSRTS